MNLWFMNIRTACIYNLRVIVLGSFQYKIKLPFSGDVYVNSKSICGIVLATSLAVSGVSGVQELQ